MRKASAEVWKVHREELKAVKDKASKEWNEFEKWKDSQIGI